MNHNRSRMAALIAPIIILLLALAGCVDNGSGPNSNEPVKATPGSYYIFKRTRYDTSGMPIPGPDRFDTFTVINTNVSAWGVSGITSFWGTAANDTSYFRYEPNGDFTVLDPTDTDHNGSKDGLDIITYPIASKTHTQLSIDTGYDSGNNYTVHRDSVVYIGDATITVPAGTFSVAKVEDLHDHRGYSRNGTYERHVREISALSFARSVGFLVYSTWEHEFIDTAGNRIARKVLDKFELVSYKVQ